MAVNSSEKIDSLTSLRFLMVAIVVVAHMEFLGGTDAPNIFNRFFQNAAVAVDFFFVLSGFGLTLSAMRDPSRLPQRYSLGRAFGYAFSRVKRLYPLYLITMLCAIPVSLLEKVYRGQSVISVAIKTLVNLIITPTLLQSASGLLSVSHGLNGVAWFLSCLFILYMLFPLLEKLNQNIRKRDLAGPALIVTFALSCLMHSAFANVERLFSPGGLTLDLAHGSPYMRVFHLFLGMLLADIYIERTYSDSSGSSTRGHITGQKATVLESSALIFALLATLLGNAVLYGKLGEIKNAVYLLAAMLLVYVFAICRGKLSLVLTKRLPVYLGNLAMYVFLIHYVIRQTIGIIVYEYLPPSAGLNTAVAASIVILTSIFTIIASKAGGARCAPTRTP